MKSTHTARAACLAVLAITLTTALPALAGGNRGDTPDSIITPGFGTLGAIVGWLRLMVF